MKTILPSTELFTTSEVEIHYARKILGETRYIHSANDANNILRKYINQNQLDLRESFWVLLLTNANQVVAISETARGTSRGTPVNAKYIFQLALLTNASAIILAHNHPSGKLAISHSDIEETKKIKKLARMMEMTLLDHIIITSESFISMKEENKL